MVRLDIKYHRYYVLLIKKLRVKYILVIEFWKLYFLVSEFQFALQMVPQFWKKTKLVFQLSFPLKKLASRQLKVNTCFNIKKEKRKNL
jgi:hypothetical protein